MGLWKTFSDVMDGIVVGPTKPVEEDTRSVWSIPIPAIGVPQGKPGTLRINYTPAKGDFVYENGTGFRVEGRLYGPYRCFAWQPELPDYECGTASGMVQHLEREAKWLSPSVLTTIKNFATLESDYGVGLGG